MTDRELPQAGLAAERADARRNRERILAAAAELVSERGLAGVRMEQIAQRAGVAKGTVFQRFGSRSGLATALVDTSERRLQDRVLSGPPPLGPGARAGARLVAFLDALADLTRDNLELLLISDYDAPGQRYETGAYAAWHLHVTTLLEASGSGRRASGLAHCLLAPLAADLVWHRLTREDADVGDLKAEVCAMARAVIG